MKNATKSATLAALAVLCYGGASAGSPPHASVSSVQTCRRDRSGVEWALPFTAALARAKAEERLLFIKPIAFGTSSDGGW